MAGRHIGKICADRLAFLYFFHLYNLSGFSSLGGLTRICRFAVTHFPKQIEIAICFQRNRFWQLFVEVYRRSTLCSDIGDDRFLAGEERILRVDQTPEGCPADTQTFCGSGLVSSSLH